MIENISLCESIEFTPNVSLYSVNDQSNTTNNESTSIPDTCTSRDSCIFYTPVASLNSDFKFIPPPTIPQESESADESFHTPMGLDSPSHIRRYLPSPIDTVLRCNICSNTYSSKNRYGNHLSRHYTGHNIWSCESCNFTFHSRKTFRYHTITTHYYEPLHRCDRNIRMISTNTGLPNKVKHSLQTPNTLTPIRFNKSHKESCLHLVRKRV